ncbi:MAG: biopolymer transporter ExbD [Planctomycetes bacterium]|nr:biopolymer transporter ExbD [Planctomycetota bacterium]
MAHVPVPDDDVKSDMTPMIDVVFLMIVFFVCIEFKTLESRLDAWLPSDRGSRDVVVQPVEQLAVRVHVLAPGTRRYLGGDGAIDEHTGRAPRFVLEGHRVRYEVGPTMCDDLAACRRELEHVAGDPASQVPDRDTGGRKLMACVVEGMPGSCYDDIAHAADACRAAGFEDLQFGGGRF